MSKEIVTPDFFTDSMIVTINGIQVSVPKKIWESRFVPCDNYRMNYKDDMYKIIFDVLSNDEISKHEYLSGIFFSIRYSIVKNTDVFEKYFMMTNDYICMSMLLGITGKFIYEKHEQTFNNFISVKILYKSSDDPLYLPIRDGESWKHQINIRHKNYRDHIAIFRDMYFTKKIFMDTIRMYYRFDETLFDMASNIIDKLIKSSAEIYP